MDAAPRVLANRYRLEARIGAGGMGIVYRGVDQELERAVAVKVVSHTEDAGARDRFLTEAKRTAAVRHPCIVEVFDVGRDGDDAFLVMELLQGETLGERVKSGPLPPADAVAIAAQICDALGAAHDGGIVHRDLKPANVFLATSQEGAPRVKLLDFGIAKRIDGATARTDPRMIVGTLEFLAPEQIKGGPLDGRADLYALGMTLYTVLSGQHPFKADNVAMLIHKHLMEAPPSMSGIPPALDAVVAKLLAKEPKERPASAREAKRELLASLDPATKPIKRPEPPARSAVGRVIEFDEVPAEGSAFELDLAGTPPPEAVRPIASVIPMARFEDTAPTPPPPVPLPAWLAPLAQVPESTSKRVAGYSVFALLLYLTFFSGHLLPSLVLAVVAALGGLSLWANRRASGPRAP